MNTEEFVAKAKSVHGDKYDYSKTIYIPGKRSKVTIICPIHGEFQQRTDTHLGGAGCRKCGYEEIFKSRTLSNEQFIAKARAVHGDKYDYSKSQYIKSYTKVIVICPIHGEFKITPNSHTDFGGECQKCGRFKNARSHSSTKEYFINRANKIHCNRYDYSKVDYLNSETEVTILCPTHGEFRQKPHGHLKGYGCQKCSMSKGELTIKRFLEEKLIDYTPQKTFDDCRGKKNRLPFDFYLPKYNLCVEYQGEQHFRESLHWSHHKLIDTQRTDSIKKNYCAENGIGYLAIPYTEDPIRLLQEVLAKDIQQQALPKCCQVA